ncbi:ATP-grasp domain-containing protein [Jeotgalibacillus marinus]|uniref:ATP-grasp domain-containing protein n=1 Tax=Jeotgalibacillus marinus TaxID=86667 RepID=A0ABV3Q3L5_9BACL
MKTIVFIGSNKSGSSREAIKAAERLGFFTVLLTDRELFFENRLDFPDVHQMIRTELTDYDLLKAKVKELQEQGKKIEAILSFIDPFVHVAAKLAKELGITAISPDPLVKMEDKVLTRELLKDLPVSPSFARYVKGDSLEDFNKQKRAFPVIVKTPISTGSKDVLFAKNEWQLEQSIDRLLNTENNEVLIEEYLEGPQYLVEACVYNGRIQIVAVIEQEITFSKRFIVTGYGLSGYIDKVFYNKIYDAVRLILKRFNMKNGAFHLEMRLVNDEWRLIEINPRISGGAMNQIIETAYGINLVEETIKIFLRQKPNLEKKFNRSVYAHYLTSNATGKLLKVTGKNRCSRLPGVEEVFIKPKKGKILQPPLSMGHRYGYVLASSDNKEEAMRFAKDAAKEIRFYLDPI